MLRYFFFLIVFSATLFRGYMAQAQLYELPFDEIMHRSAIIVEGRVVGQQSFWDTRHRNIYTSNTIELSAVYKGAGTVPAVLQVITCGGIVDDHMELVSELVHYAVGDAGLFCLIPSVRDIPIGAAWENYGSPHGFFRYNLWENRVEHPFHPAPGIASFQQKVIDIVQEPIVSIPGHSVRIPVPDRFVPAISSFSPTSISAGTESLLTINGTGFGNAPGSVRFINSNSGAAFTADASDIVSWSDTQIQIIVPSTSSSGGCAGTGPITVVDQGGATATSATSLTVEFGYTNIISGGTKYGSKLVTTNGNGGMTFTLSTSLCSNQNQDAVNAIGRALRAWRCVSGVNWRLSTTTTSINAPASDGVNVITYDVGSPLSGGVLGVAFSYYSACFSGGDFRWRVSEVDVNLKQSVNWYFCDNPAAIPNNSFDFQTVVFHELGHGHQLSHIVDASATMHRSIGNGQVRRTLNANEESGANYVLGLPANPCGPGPMTLLGQPACLNLTPPSACNSAGACTLSLPVELVRFSGSVDNTKVVLEWATATEHNNQYFTLERSPDARHFELVQQVPGAGNSTQLKPYQYIDVSPLPGLSYYRLQQTDYDGQTALLGLVAVHVSAGADALRVFPNPVFGDELFLVMDHPNAEMPTELMLTDLPGRVIRRYRPDTDVSEYKIALNGIPPGTYLLIASRGDNRQLLRPILLVRQ